ncbi:MAG: 4Fe-4S binding protein [Candidatus Hydrothermarchaeales archaeon]
MSFTMKVEDDKCSGCGNCVIVCPVNALNSLEIQGGKGDIEAEYILSIGKGIAYVFDPDLCNGCGSCIKACAHDAVLLESIQQIMTAHMKKSDELEILGERGQVYEMIKKNGATTVSKIAESLEIPPSSVLRYVTSLKSDSKIWEVGRKDGAFIYSAERPEKEKAGKEKMAKIKVDMKKYKKFKRRIDAAIESFSMVKVRLFTETGKLDKAKNTVKEKISEAK